MASTSHFLSASPRLRTSSYKQFPLGNPSSLGELKSLFRDCRRHKHFNVKPIVLHERTSPGLSCAVNMAAGHSGDPERMGFHHLLDKAKELWDSSPQPVKDFPWNRALEKFIQLILDLVFAVMKILSVPLFAITSVSEMSYCAHEKKLLLVPFPLLTGIVVAGFLKDTALEVSPLLKDSAVPWHLIVIAIFFTLLKLPGPYYPYWGRIFIPHLANGVLLRTLWSLLLWYKQPRKGLPQDPIKSSHV